MKGTATELRGRPIGRVVAGAGGLATVALLAANDIHGAAPAAGAVIGALLAPLDRAGPQALRPSRPQEGALEP